MKPTKEQIRSEITKLRVIIDNSGNDDVLARIAYAVETALRWSIENTEDWETPSQDVFEEARILKTQLKMGYTKV